MPRFYFHLHECGEFIGDPDGQELASLADAQAQAIVEAREVMSAEVRDGRLCLSCCIVIEDGGYNERARVLFRDVLTVTGL